MKGCRKPKQRFDGNAHDALSDIQAFVFLLGCRNKQPIKVRTVWREKRVTLRMLCSGIKKELNL